ncbi:MAG: hypothetical protein KDA16_10405 [Phycisphaerales bacterium]|nr:hypothetical protein [Phycisphaerales bacterium]
MSQAKHDRATAEQWLLELTSIPTAAGREDRVIAWIREWVGGRDDLRLSCDASGNLVVDRKDGGTPGATPLYITAHLDHPAFVVEKILNDGRVEMGFRGGVRDAYFRDAPIVIHPSGGGAVRGRVESTEQQEPYRKCVVRLEDGGEVEVGDIGVWALPDAEIVDGIVHTPACDDLAALAAALAAMDVIRGIDRAGHVRLLFTRAEEIGFIGAIAACRDRTMTPGAKVLALENSRSFAESPIGGGPIVRVGDRMSTFSPALTAAVCAVCETLAKEAKEAGGEYKWQRRLMPGGACEATAFQAYGYEATCVCLPLGNYHNMADLDLVERGDEAAVAHARCGREYIGVEDYHGLIEMLIACATRLDEAPDVVAKMEKLFADKSFVLG